MAEPRRWKLKPKQWEALVNSTARLNAALENLELQKQRSQVESDLIMEALGLDPAMKVTVDPQTQELVEVVEAAAEPAKKTRKAKTPTTVQ